MPLNVTPEALRRELRHLGFNEYETDGLEGVTWVGPSSTDGLSVVVPREEDEEIRGYDETIASALQRLAWITGEPVREITARLAGMRDRIELRILHEVTEHHGVPVRSAPEVMNGFVALIKSGARTRFKGARADHRGKGGPDYELALNAIQVLAPAPGSFRLVAASSDTPQMTVARPVTRARDALAATLRSVGALSAVSGRATDLDEEAMLRLVDSGVSMQLLGAVKRLTISQTSGLELEFSGSWDPSLGGVPDVPTAPVVLRDRHVAFARELRDRLAAYEPVENYPLAGWAETLRASDQSLEGFPSGTVVVRSRHAGRLRDVLVELPTEYFTAVKPGVSDLNMTGTLERISGRWHLLAPRSIQVVDPSGGATDRPEGHQQGLDESP